MGIFAFKFRFRSICMIRFGLMRSGFFALCAFTGLLAMEASAQRIDRKDQPVVVRPGAPGQSTRELPSSSRAVLPPLSAKDVEFMQGMIMHHAQAVEMTALIEARTENKELRLLGARISQSQSDEINFMRRWLEMRNAKGSPSMPKMSGMNMHGMKMPGMNMPDMKTEGADKAGQPMLMPGMLTPKQMEALRNSKGAEFDRLFLTGMIQHHGGALIMVKDLFDTAGAGQDAELFNFATDVDSGQRAEIKIMQTMLGENP